MRFPKFPKALKPFLRRKESELELDDEVRFHLEMEARKLEREGLASGQARLEARRRFGGVDRVMEECRDQRPARFFETLLQDLRYGLRTFRRNPVSSAAAIATLALGIGANAAVFSVIYGVLLSPLPYGAGDRLVVVRQHAPAENQEDVGFSPPEIRDVQSSSTTLQDFVEYHRMWFTLLGGDEPQRVSTGVVSHQYFQTLGIQPAMGRAFVPGDEREGAEPVLLVSHEFWTQELASDPEILGSTFEMNDRVHTVVGVLPPLPQHPHANDVYMPTSACPFRSAPRVAENRVARGYYTLGRLLPEVSLEQARAELQGLADGMAAKNPEAYPPSGSLEIELEPLHQALTKDVKPALMLLLVTVGLVLLIACANVASLNLAQLSSRRRELVLRRSLGAGRRRLARQLITEGALLGLAGGLLGTLLAAGAVNLMTAFASRLTVRAAEIRLDPWVILATLLLSISCGLLLGLMGTLQANPRTNLGAPQGASPRDATSLRRWLVLGQLAVSAVLLVGAGLMVRSLLNLRGVEAGFEAENVLTAEVNLNWTRYDSPEKRLAFFRRLLEDLRAEPGVEGAALTSAVPLDGSLRPRPILIEAMAEDAGRIQPMAQPRIVTDGYFETLGIQVLEGRPFRLGDDGESPSVAILSRALARHYWPNGTALGQRISFDEGATWNTVVGIVADVKQRSLADEAQDEVYVPMAQNPMLSGRLLLRAARRPLELIRPVRRTVYGIDGEQPVVDFQTLEQIRSTSTEGPRLVALLLGLFALLALLITVAGLTGLLAFTVSQRVREIGLRMALGATPGGVRRMVLGQVMAITSGGLLLGGLASLVASYSLESYSLGGQELTGQLFGVEPHDPATFAAVGLLLLIAAALACWGPVRRATHIDPMSALRND